VGKLPPHHPRVAPFGQFVGGGDKIGLLTMPAGPLVIALAISVLAWLPRMNSGAALPGWMSLGRALIILVVILVEISQLILG
jgi:hypothetical protein